MDFRIDAGFPHPPRNQLGELRTKIDDQDAVGHVGGPSGWMAPDFSEDVSQPQVMRGMVRLRIWGRCPEMRFLRVVALVEAVAFLLLIFVAVPLKHLAGIPEPVLVLGPVHGLTFLLYVWLITRMAVEQAWPRRRVVRLVAFGLVPLAP